MAFVPVLVGSAPKPTPNEKVVVALKKLLSAAEDGQIDAIACVALDSNTWEPKLVWAGDAPIALMASYADMNARRLADERDQTYVEKLEIEGQKV